MSDAIRLVGLAVGLTVLALTTPAHAAPADICCQYTKPDACARPGPNGCGKAKTVSGATCVGGKTCVTVPAGATRPTGQGKR